MVDPISEAHRHSIEQFFYAYRAFTAIPDRILEQQGLSRVHHRILYFVGRNPGLSVNQLLRTLGVTKQALNGPLRQLIEKGLVAADGAEHDRRIKQLSLTPGGGELEASLTGSQAHWLSTVFTELEPQAEATWLTVMRKMAGNVE